MPVQTNLYDFVKKPSASSSNNSSTTSNKPLISEEQKRLAMEKRQQRKSSGDSQTTLPFTKQTTLKVQTPNPKDIAINEEEETSYTAPKKTVLPSPIGGKSSSTKKKNTSTKRKKLDDDDDFNPEEDEDDDFNGMDLDEEEVEEEEVPKKKTKKTTTKKSTKSTSKKSATKRTTKKKKKDESDDDDDGNYKSKYATTQKKKKKDKEDRFPFLINRQDANRRKPGDEDYDPSTLFISTADECTLSGMEKQYWQIKKYHMDKIVFFKKGKFYELYEEDADIGKKEFDLKMTERVNMRMVGVPESSFRTWAAKFINLGYTVVRVEQMETAAEKKKRKTEKGSASSCLERSVCDIVTLATITDLDLLPDSSNNYLLCLKEDMMNHRYGITFVDLSTDNFFIGYLEDDQHSTQFNTLIHSINPVEVLYEQGQVSANTKKNLKVSEKTFVRPKKPTQSEKDFAGFPSAEVTKRVLEMEDYFLDSTSGKNEIPEAIQKFYNNDIVMSSFGCCLFYLKYLKKDDVLRTSSATFKVYDGKVDIGHLILDGQTLVNLDVKINSSTGTKEGTLLQFIDHTSTAMGKRLLEQWVTRPLKDVNEINDRLDAIEDLDNFDVDGIKSGLSQIRDIDRMCSSLYREARKEKEEVIFDPNAPKRKIKTYIDTLANFRKCYDLINNLQDQIGNIKSNALKRTLIIDDNSGFPNIDEILSSFENSIDVEEAKETGIIEPTRDQNPDYFEMDDEMETINKELEDFLSEVQKKMKSKDIKYSKPKNSNTWTIEIPIELKDKVIDGLKYSKAKKKFISYTSLTVDKKLEQLKLLETKKEQIRTRQFKFILSKFGEHAAMWKKVVDRISELDCLISLFAVSRSGVFVRPRFITSEKPTLKVTQLRHPTVKTTTSEFVPNNITIGDDDPTCIIVTGPNMGGKSTILRSSCIVIILAQLGCYVPAEDCEMTIVDRIFTRIGANDRIMAGESTFMVELTETSNILRHATKNSLVILDELGRGTSTHDGYAIACAVVQYIADYIGCACLFSTHYYELTEELKFHPNIAMYQMLCAVDKDEEGKILEVTFLYEFVKGVCEKSYGIQVAKKAGVPIEVVEQASAIAEAFEKTMREKKPICYDDVTEEQYEILERAKVFATQLSQNPNIDREELLGALKILQSEILKSYSSYTALIEEKEAIENLPMEEEEIE
ncbi:hypothetical protein ABK040_000240 [Willaertia magna]